MGGSPHVDMYGMCRFQSDRLSGSTVRVQVFYCIPAQPGSAAITTHANKVPRFLLWWWRNAKHFQLRFVNFTLTLLTILSKVCGLNSASIPN